MHKPYVILVYLAFFAVTACRDSVPSRPELKLVHSRTLRALPSASGITASEKGFLVNSDNAPYLYTLDTAGAVKDSLPLLNEDPRLHEIPKPVKSDYEAAAVVSFEGRSGLLLLGSGTQSPHRDSALLIGVQQRKASLRPFYNVLVAAGMAEQQVNIEAAACSGNRLMLFNRGTNELITISADSFLNALFHATPLPVFYRYMIPLPAVDGFNPGISGAAMLDDSTVLFCGSVEATNDWAKDGEILGSGIGIIRLGHSGRPTLLRWNMLPDASGKRMREKLEGIEIVSRGGKALVVRCVADNDNGSSTLLDLELSLPE